MSMYLEIHAEPDLLIVETKGTFSLDEAKRTFREMLEAVALHRTTRVLVDGRTLQGQPEAMERFYYGEFAARTVREFSGQGVSPATRFAYMLKEPVLDPKRLGENVAVNRGMVVKMFDNHKDALEWLSAGPAG